MSLSSHDFSNLSEERASFGEHSCLIGSCSKDFWFGAYWRDIYGDWSSGEKKKLRRGRDQVVFDDEGWVWKAINRSVYDKGGVTLWLFVSTEVARCE